MRIIVQRVREAKVVVNNKTVGEIGKGLLVLLAIHKNDSEEQAKRLVRKTLQLRIFSNDAGKMNLNVTEAQGSVLVVSQFTLYGNTAKGNRPSYDCAASPDKARVLYEFFLSQCRESGINTAAGIFQAHMDVHLVNNGPVTLLCDAES